MKDKRVQLWILIAFLLACTTIGYAAVPQSTIRTTGGGITTYVGHYFNFTEGLYQGATQLIDDTGNADLTSVDADQYYLNTVNITNTVIKETTTYTIWTSGLNYKMKNGFTGETTTETYIASHIDAIKTANPSGYYHILLKRGNYTQHRGWDFEGADNWVLSGSGPGTVITRKDQSTTTLTAGASIGEDTVTVTSVLGFIVGEEIEINDGANYDTLIIDSIGANTLTFTTDLTNNYNIGDPVFSVWTQIESNYADNIYLRDLTLDGNNNNWPTTSVPACSYLYCTYFWRGDNKNIENVVFQNYLRVAADMGPSGDNGYARSYITNCEFLNGGVGIVIQSMNSSGIISDCTFTNITGQEAIEGEKCSYISVDNCRFDDISQYAFYANGYAGVIQFTNNRGEGLIQTRSEVGGTYVGNNVMYNCSIYIQGKSTGENCKTFVCSENQILSMNTKQKYGIYLKDCENGILESNIVTGLGTEIGGYTGIRIYTDVVNVTISNNKITNARYGIDWNGGAAWFYVHDNDLGNNHFPMYSTISSGAILRDNEGYTEFGDLRLNVNATEIYNSTAWVQINP